MSAPLREIEITPVRLHQLFLRLIKIHCLQIQSKLPNVGTTIFTVMSSLAVQHNAINLGQGFPDFAMNEELIALVNEAMENGYNQYVHMNGYIPLRESIAEKAEFLYKIVVNPDTQIT